MRTRRIDGAPAGSTEAHGWQNLADAAWYRSLQDVVDRIGDPTFGDKLADSLRFLVPFDYTVTFAYNGSEVPLCLHHIFPAHRLYEVHVTEYRAGSYLLDPFYRATLKTTAPGLYRLSELAPPQFFKSEYYRSYYAQTGPVDEIAFFISGNENWKIVASLMRAAGQSGFSAHEMKRLRCVEPLIQGLAERHWRTDERLKSSAPAQREEIVMRRAIGDALSRRHMPALTPREIEVVQHMLHGHSSESTAETLGISAGTVRIHRKNIYAKMRISSQRELFAIFVQQGMTEA